MSVTPASTRPFSPDQNTSCSQSQQDWGNLRLILEKWPFYVPAKPWEVVLNSLKGRASVSPETIKTLIETWICFADYLNPSTQEPWFQTLKEQSRRAQNFAWQVFFWLKMGSVNKTEKELQNNLLFRKWAIFQALEQKDLFLLDHLLSMEIPPFSIHDHSQMVFEAVINHRDSRWRCLLSMGPVDRSTWERAWESRQEPPPSVPDRSLWSPQIRVAVLLARLSVNQDVMKHCMLSLQERCLSLLPEGVYGPQEPLTLTPNRSWITMAYYTALCFAPMVKNSWFDDWKARVLQDSREAHSIFFWFREGSPQETYQRWKTDLNERGLMVLEAVRQGDFFLTEYLLSMEIPAWMWEVAQIEMEKGNWAENEKSSLLNMMHIGYDDPT